MKIDDGSILSDNIELKNQNKKKLYSLLCSLSKEINSLRKGYAITKEITHDIHIGYYYFQISKKYYKVKISEDQIIISIYASY